MEHHLLLEELFLLTAVAVLAVLVLGSLRLPPVTGLIAAGMVLGPQGLGLVKDREGLEELAEAGVVLLLFSIGLEFSQSRLRHILRFVTVGGMLQVGLTMILAAPLAFGMGFQARQGAVLAFMVALSSTAIVLRELSDRGSLDSPHGKLIVGALLFQDFAVIPFLLFLPLLGQGDGPGLGLSLMWALLRALGLAAGAVIFSRWIVSPLFGVVSKNGSREVFLLAVLALLSGVLWLTSLAGLSLSLGAFLAGIVLAESEFGHRALGDILPLRDFFMSVFFISLGTVVNLEIFATFPGSVAGLFGGILLGKWLAAGISALAMGFPGRVAFLAGVGLAQVGEFGFVVVKEAERLEILARGETDILLAAAVLTMLVTPVFSRWAPHFTAGERILRPLERLLGVRGVDETLSEHQEMKNHVVVVGYGLAGQILSKALWESKVPHLVLELAVDRVRVARQNGLPVYYGDITSPEAMKHAGLTDARALVLLINDQAAVHRALVAVRSYAPKIPIFVRTRYAAQQEELLRLGAADVVVEEAEAGMEIMARVLRLLGSPRNFVVNRIRIAREAVQTSARKITLPRRKLGEVEDLAALRVDHVHLAEGSFGCGRSAVEMALRSLTGALVVAVKRKGVLIDAFEPRETFQEGDTVYLVGSGAAMGRAAMLLETGEAPEGEEPDVP